MTELTITEDFPKKKLNLNNGFQTQRLVTIICSNINGQDEFSLAPYNQAKVIAFVVFGWVQLLLDTTVKVH